MAKAKINNSKQKWFFFRISIHLVTQVYLTSKTKKGWDFNKSLNELEQLVPLLLLATITCLIYLAL